MLKTWTKKEVLHAIRNYALIVLGCFLLAAGDAIFITPFNILPGGIISVGIIVQHFVDAAGIDFQVVDIVTWILQISLVIVSFIFLGKKFTLHTFFATLIYPGIFTILYRIPMVNGLPIGQFLADQLVKTSMEGTASTSVLLLASIFGGAMIGGGVATTYHADGSTGGFDVISVIIAKHTPIKEALSCFIIDGTLILIGIIVKRDLALGLIGVLSSFVCAAVVQYFYVNSSSYVIADIVSSKSEEIQKYVIEDMDHTTTVMDVHGGYSGEEKILIRVAFNKRELHDFREFIASVDPRAFVTFTTASMINGEGFDPLSNKEEKTLQISNIAKRKKRDLRDSSDSQKEE